MLSMSVPVAVAVIGLLAYALAKDKVARIGEIMFAVGLLVATWRATGLVP